MPRRKPRLGEFPEKITEVDVNVHADHLNGTGRLVGKVSRSKVTTQNLIARAAQRNRIFSGDLLMVAAMELRDEIVRALKNGECADVLGLGELYLALDGSIQSMRDTPSKMPKFEARFSVSKTLKKELSLIKVNRLFRSSSAPEISRIRKYSSRGTEELTVPRQGMQLFWKRKILTSADKDTLIYLEGTNLKVGGEGCGIVLEHTETGSVFVIPMERLSDNYPRKLSFYLPQDIAPGVYSLRIRTKFHRNGTERKAAAESSALFMEVV